VEFTGADTFFGKTASLLQGDNEISNLQLVLISIVLRLTLASIALCVINFAYLMGSGVDVVEALSFTIVLLVASIPLAIEIVTTTTLAIGSKQLSHHGAIVARLAAIEDLAAMSILCSDKTGTLTKNIMELQEQTPTYVSGITQYSLLRYAAMAAKWNEPARDALDTLVLNSVDKVTLEVVEQLAYMPFDPIVKRTEGTIRSKASGEVFKVTKGAPHVLLKLCRGGDGTIERAVENDVHELGKRGIRSLAVARTTNASDGGQWEMLGLLTFLDPPREDTKKTIEDARLYGVAVKMITGDRHTYTYTHDTHTTHTHTYTHTHTHITHTQKG